MADPDPNLRFHKIEKVYGALKVDGSRYIEENDRKKYQQIIKELTKHVGQLIRDNKEFFQYSEEYGEFLYFFQTSVNPWGKQGPDARIKTYFAVCSISSWTSRSAAGEKSSYAPDERFDIGPDEWFNLKPDYFDETWDSFEGFVLFDYSDPDNIKIRTSWLEQAILKWRQEQHGKVPTTDTYKRKRDINDVQVTVQGYVF